MTPEQVKERIENIVISCFIKEAGIISSTEKDYFILHVKPDAAFTNNPIKITLPLKILTDYPNYSEDERADFEQRLINFIKENLRKSVVWEIHL